MLSSSRLLLGCGAERRERELQGSEGGERTAQQKPRAIEARRTSERGCSTGEHAAVDGDEQEQKVGARRRLSISLKWQVLQAAGTQQEECIRTNTTALVDTLSKLETARRNLFVMRSAMQRADAAAEPVQYFIIVVR